MTLNIGEVATFPNVQPNKAQVLKIAEEYSEVYSAWENYQESARMYEHGHESYSGFQFAAA